MMPKPKPHTLTDGTAFEMIPIEGGSFTMGGKSGYLNSEPFHLVELNNFYLSRTLVSQALWEVVMGNNHSVYRHPQRPVEMVNWYKAVEFCNRLSELMLLEPFYIILKDPDDPFDIGTSVVQINPGARGYRLPTEAEWEYAARGGKYARKTEYAGSHNRKEVAWFDWNSQNISQPVGLKRPNSLGLYDMSGNVCEWCHDWYSQDYYNTCFYNRTVSNPFGPFEGQERVRRGGAWYGSHFSEHRVATRKHEQPGLRYAYTGFRLSRY